MSKELFFDYGELLFAYRFTPETLMRAHSLMLSQLARFSGGLAMEQLASAHKLAIQAYLKSRRQSGEEWRMDRIMGLFLGNLGIADEEAVRLATENYKLHDHDAFPMHGIPELIPELAGTYSLHIISNLPHDSALHRLRGHGLLEHFNTVTFSYEAGYRKPRPEIYQLALQRARCNPNQGFFISHDQEEVDGARRVGMQASLATNADEIRGVLHENYLY